MSRVSSWVSKYFALMAKHSVWAEFPQYAQEIYEAGASSGEGVSGASAEVAGNDIPVNAAEPISGTAGSPGP